MLLRSLSILNFKNYPDATFTTDRRINAFTGANGAGKTNILDAIHYLALCKSYFNPVDSQNVLHEEPFFVIQGTFEHESESFEIHCSVKKGQRKVFKKNKKEYERLADHIGLIPLVMATPADTDLILEGSEIRRKFVDSVIVQYDREYLESLINYNKSLVQRNTLLKQFQETGSFDRESLALWDYRIIEVGKIIHKKRSDFYSDFLPLFNENYLDLSGGNESVSLLYDSDLNDTEASLLIEKTLDRDRISGYTTGGIHKDDFEFLLGSHPLKKTASQGQQKSFLIALKLAQYKWLKQKKGVSPLLLLDDIYDKLDDTRVQKLMKIVSDDNFGQVFITDTSSSRIQHVFSLLNLSASIFSVDNNTVKPLL